MIWFSLLVLIPLSAVVVEAAGGGWEAYWSTLTNSRPRRPPAHRRRQSFLVTAVNMVMGTLIAWVLVRDRFRGKRVPT